MMARSRFAARCLFAVGVVSALVVMASSPASAHAVIVSSSPSPGTGLPQAPGGVQTRFSEPLNRRLSSIEVLDRAGHDVGEGPTRAVAGDRRAMERKLGLLRPGQYTVRWTTVSVLDGHVLAGSYTFGIGLASAANEVVHDTPVSSEGWLGLAGRLAALVGLALWAGMAVNGDLGRRAGVAEPRLRLLWRAAPILVLAGTAASVLSSAVVSSGSPARFGDVLLASRSGHWRLVLLGAAAVAVVLRGRLRTAGRMVAAVAVVAEASSGHAAATALPVLATASATVHLVAVGIWVFAIAAAWLSSERVAQALRVLSPWAIGAAVVVALTGVANAALELSRPSDLFSTGYGAGVVAKAVAFVTMAGLGLTHYRRRRRALPVLKRLRSPLLAELGASVVALAVATALVGLPNPPRQVEAAERVSGGDPVLARLAHLDALAVADASGQFVVGLTVLPPRPGPVELRLQVVGVEAGDGLRQARVTATGPRGESRHVDLGPCGLGCFTGRGEVDAAGAWRIETSIVSNRGLLATTTTVPLPAADGSAELHRALEALEGLRSARMHEELRGSAGGPIVGSDYAFQAPDAFEFHVNGSDEIVIGSQTFRREGPARPWTAQGSGFAFRWPGSYFRSFWGPGVAPRILGEEEVGGVASQVVAFVRPDLPAWFRVWVGPDGLVRREEMRAEGHLMDHTWTHLNQPLDIRPPQTGPSS